ncbi:MAG: hypothetical protein OYK82_09425 [Gammaproteobacteria bacterium]|nr:hypothetical protein [Gammaproteobacteria bacterium]
MPAIWVRLILQRKVFLEPAGTELLALIDAETLRWSVSNLEGRPALFIGEWLDTHYGPTLRNRPGYWPTRAHQLADAAVNDLNGEILYDPPELYEIRPGRLA